VTGAVLLSAIALWAGGKPVTVTVEGYGTLAGRAFVSGDQIWLSRESAKLAERGNGVGVFILLHETGHTTGLKECASDRWALAHLRKTLKRFWPRLKKSELDYRVREAQRYPKYLGLPGFCEQEEAQP
jgi:hypothetical protein